MPAPQTTLWPIDRHTQAKHEILRRYLGAWFPILIQHFQRARIIDGFAGPGEYKGHEPGSPIIAIDALRRSVSNSEQMRKVAFLFIDERENRCGHLYGQISKLQRSDPLFSYKLQNKLQSRKVCKNLSGDCQNDTNWIKYRQAAHRMLTEEGTESAPSLTSAGVAIQTNNKIRSRFS